MRTSDKDETLGDILGHYLNREGGVCPYGAIPLGKKN